MSSVRYEPQTWYRKVAWVFVGLFGVAGVLGVVALAVSGTPAGTAVLIGVLLAAVCGFMIYMLLTKTDRLELTAGSLRWSSMAKTGEIPLTELAYVSRVPGRAVTFGSAGGRMIRMRDSEHIADFVSDIRRVAPQVDVPAELRAGG